VAHARDVRLIGESRRKDDKMDAQALARLARIDPQLLSPIQHCSAEAQADLGNSGTLHTGASKDGSDLCDQGLTKSFGELTLGAARPAQTKGAFR
jgi:hypothetical protein